MDRKLTRRLPEWSIGREDDRRGGIAAACSAGRGGDEDEATATSALGSIPAGERTVTARRSCWNSQRAIDAGGTAGRRRGCFGGRILVWGKQRGEGEEKETAALRRKGGELGFGREERLAKVEGEGAGGGAHGGGCHVAFSPVVRTEEEGGACWAGPRRGRLEVSGLQAQV